MATVLSIDPGNEESAWVLYDLKTGKPVSFAKEKNDRLMQIECGTYSEMAIEMVACYGMPVGATIFETCVWIGRYVQQLAINRDVPYKLIYRKKDVCPTICHSSKAKDSNIRQALIDLYGEPGTKKNPGVLYGIKADIWSALAIAHTYKVLYRSESKLNLE